MILPAAFSPCPNDTFLFHAWVSGNVGGDISLLPVLADIQQLNEWALKGKYPFSKVSFGCLGQILNDYILLPVGAALGRDCGPKIIARKHFPLSELSKKSIAIPGKLTTAHQLLRILVPAPKSKHFCLYHEVPALIRKGAIDCGVIIHEQRFTYQEQGFVEIADLGKLWEAHFACPIPLGGLVAKRSLGFSVLRKITYAIQASLSAARADPKATHPYVLAHSQEKKPEVVQEHINLYINQESYQISDSGVKGIETLLSLGSEEALPQLQWLFDR